jgi:Raf kinase inhibitor-like YbhB/YbcL family protein
MLMIKTAKATNTRNTMFGMRQTCVAAAGIMLLAVTAYAAEPFSLTSSSFKEGELIPAKMGGSIKQNPNCVGENVSPALSWSNPPAGTTSYALLMFDPEANPPEGVSQWVAYGIPVSVTGFAEGETSKQTAKYVGGKNQFGLPHYAGPCTPPGGPHHYMFSLIATDLEPHALQPGLTRDELIKALDGHAKGAAVLIGRFKHS